jgi:hypothetical protein
MNSFLKELFEKTAGKTVDKLGKLGKDWKIGSLLGKWANCWNSLFFFGCLYVGGLHVRLDHKYFLFFTASLASVSRYSLRMVCLFDLRRVVTFVPPRVPRRRDRDAHTAIHLRQ